MNRILKLRRPLCKNPMHNTNKLNKIKARNLFNDFFADSFPRA